MKARIVLLLMTIWVCGIAVAMAAQASSEAVPIIDAGSFSTTECLEVVTTDFQGTVCTAPDREERAGQWLNVDSGAFKGKAKVYKDSRQTQILTKQGDLTTPTFQGTLRYEEVKTADGKISTKERLEGKERLTDGGIFEGYIETWINPRLPGFYPGGGGERRIKGGKLTTPTFEGTLKYGEERKGLDKKVESKERLEGIWRVTPTLKLGGYIEIVNGKVTDRRVQINK